MTYFQQSMMMLWLLLCLSPLAWAEIAVENKPQITQFKVFDATLYRNKPSLKDYGIEPIEILYAARFWSNTSSSRFMEQLPDENQVRSVGRSLRSVRTPVVIDIEHWPLDGSEAQFREYQAKYITVLQWLRNEAPTLNMGYFGRLPGVAYHWSLEERDSRHSKVWQNENSRLDDFSMLVDTIYLPLYTYHPDR